jgi:CDGSH-type Zn-finger protein
VHNADSTGSLLSTESIKHRLCRCNGYYIARMSDNRPYCAG